MSVDIVYSPNILSFCCLFWLGIKCSRYVVHSLSSVLGKLCSFVHVLVAIVCSSSLYGFWLPLWYLQTLLVALYLSLFSLGDCTVYPFSNYTIWLPLWYLQIFSYVFSYQYSNKYNIDCFQIYNNIQILYDFISLLLIVDLKK